MKAWNSITWRSRELAADKKSNTGENEMRMEMIPSDYLSRETSRSSYQLSFLSIEWFTGWFKNQNSSFEQSSDERVEKLKEWKFKSQFRESWINVNTETYSLLNFEEDKFKVMGTTACDSCLISVETANHFIAF